MAGGQAGPVHRRPGPARRGRRRHARPALEKHGIGAGIESTKALSMSSTVPADGVAMVCLSYLDATSPAHMRYMTRRARRKWPDAKVLFGCWLAEGDATSLAATLKPDAFSKHSGPAPRTCHRVVVG